MKWVTRKSIRVNRAATAWLIRRFVDREASFEFVEPEQVAAVQARDGARGFDAPGATYPHLDPRGRCSFEALVEEHAPRDEALRELARIVHAADIGPAVVGPADVGPADVGPADVGPADVASAVVREIESAPEAAGLRAISQGFPLVARDDFETLERASFLYDALYASLSARIGRERR